jgi:hypothetical protein
VEFWVRENLGGVDPASRTIISRLETDSSIDKFFKFQGPPMTHDFF